MKKQLIIVRIILLLLIVGLSGCNEQTLDNEKFQQNINNEQKSIYIDGYDDRILHSYIEIQTEQIDERLDDIGVLINNVNNYEDWEEIKPKYDSLKNYTNESTEKIKKLNVSSEWVSIKTDYIAYLSEMYWVGWMGYYGAWNMYIYQFGIYIGANSSKNQKYYTDAQTYFEDRDYRSDNAIDKLESVTIKINDLLS